MDTFNSTFKSLLTTQLPSFSGTRVMMMPIILGDHDSIPSSLDHYRRVLDDLFDLYNPAFNGNVGYITIDEKRVEPVTTHRRAGLHVDGIFHGKAGGWGGGPGGSWGSVGTGMLTVSNPAGCRAWNKTFVGWPGAEGECDHLMEQATDAEATMFEPNRVYWVSGLCVHESVPAEKPIDRQFVRLSLPSDGPWFEGYTENPLGIKPTGEVLPRRPFM